MSGKESFYHLAIRSLRDRIHAKHVANIRNDPELAAWNSGSQGPAKTGPTELIVFSARYKRWTLDVAEHGGRIMLIVCLHKLQVSVAPIFPSANLGICSLEARLHPLVGKVLRAYAEQIPE